jgi:DNA-binding MarR family transcriptional regulator
LNLEDGRQSDHSAEKSQEASAPDELDALKSLGVQLSDSSLKSSTRILILFSLALNSKLGFVDLLALTGTGKGSLSNHLEKLEASGFIETRSVMTFGGSRVEVRITQKGKEAYENLVKTLGKLQK